MRVITTINWPLEKIIEHYKKKRVNLIFNFGDFERLEGYDLIKLDFLRSLFEPLIYSSTKIIINIEDYCNYKSYSYTKIDQYFLRYKVYFDNLYRYELTHYFIDHNKPVDGYIFNKIYYQNSNKYEQSLLTSMWRDNLLVVRGEDVALGIYTAKSIEEAKPKSICYDCEFFNQEHVYYPTIGCAVHPEHKKYHISDCKDYKKLMK